MMNRTDKKILFTLFYETHRAAADTLPPIKTNRQIDSIINTDSVLHRVCILIENTSSAEEPDYKFVEKESKTNFL